MKVPHTPQKILVDSDAFISIRFLDQSTHAEALKIFHKLQKQKAELYCLNLCIYETATVISHKYSQEKAIDFFNDLKITSPIVLNLDPVLEQRTWELFLSQTKKGTSFIDCANMTALSYYNFDKIFSFDQFYPKSIRLI